MLVTGCCPVIGSHVQVCLYFSGAEGVMWRPCSQDFMLVPECQHGQTPWQKTSCVCHNVASGPLRSRMRRVHALKGKRPYTAPWQSRRVGYSSPIVKEFMNFLRRQASKQIQGGADDPFCRQAPGKRKAGRPASTASGSEQDESQMSEDGEAEAGAGPEAEEETAGDQETDSAKHEARAVIDQQPVSPSKLLLSTCSSLHPF